jgi:Polyketide synthesis cyclase
VTERRLIVARLEPGSAPKVARLFASSDAGELPFRLGVTRRHLFSYHDLYFHYVEFSGDARKALADARESDGFRVLSRQLDDHIKPFDPATWRSPADAMASEFYAWTPDRAGAGL